eukprot:RCo014474
MAGKGLAFSERVEAKFSKRVAALGHHGVSERRGLVFLVLSGALNPVHKMHVEIMEIALTHLQTCLPNLAVIGGFLVPSSEDYVRAKLRSEAMSLTHRVAMCEQAVEDSEWLAVSPCGMASATRICNMLRQHLSPMFPGHSIHVFAVFGTDYVEKYCLWNHVCSPPIVCVARPGSTEAVEKGLRSAARKSSVYGSDVNGIFLVHGTLSELSSTAIRHLIASEKFDELVRLQWVAPAVADYLRTHRRNLYFS